VKPHNAMLVGRVTSERVSVKLGDFGIAVRLPHGRLLRDKAGSPAFMAPEMHLLPDGSAGYDHKVDAWAVGAVAVFLLAHQHAFVDEAGRLMREELLRGDLPIWEGGALSGLLQRVAGMGARRPPSLAQDFVHRLLAPNPLQRPTAQGALKHKWLRQPAPRPPDRPGGRGGAPTLLRGGLGGGPDGRPLPGVAAWVADTCGLEALVQRAASPMRARHCERRRQLAANS